VQKISVKSHQLQLQQLETQNQSLKEKNKILEDFLTKQLDLKKLKKSHRLCRPREVEEELNLLEKITLLERIRQGLTRDVEA
jgi:hypothetical protein